MPAAATIHHRSTQRFAAASPVYELYAPRGRRWRAVFSLTLGLLSLLLAAVRSQAVLVMFPDFSNTTGLVLHGDAATAATTDGTVLRLVPANFNSNAGTVYGSTKVSASTFSTAFEFRITNPGGITDSAGQSGADGFTFLIQNDPRGLAAIGADGFGLGIQGISPSLAVEFDTFSNSEISTNHLGIDIDGNVNSVTTANVPTRFDNEQKWTAWIDYDGSTLEVRASTDGIRPTSALLSQSITLATTLNASSIYLGFTASTGGAWGNYDILSWTYSDSFVSGGVNVPSAVPEPGVSALLGVGLGLLLWRRRERLHSAKRT